MKARAFIVILVLSAAGQLIACSQGKLDPSETLRIRLLSDPQTLDLNRAYTPTETLLLMNLMEGLIEVDDQLRIQPALAEKWDISKDQKSYTFHLRAAAKWSDGQSVTADQFIESWKRLLTKKTAASYADLLFMIEGAQEFYDEKAGFDHVGVRALNPRTLQVRLKKPFPAFLSVLGFWVTFPVRIDLIEKWGPHFTDPEHWVGTGPFNLHHRVADSKWVLKKNPLYRWTSDAEKNRAPEWIEGRIIADHSTALALYDQKQLDVLGDLSPIDLERLSTSPDLHAFPYLKTVYLGFVVDQPSSLSKEVRRKIAQSLHTELLPALLKGRQIPATGWVPEPLRQGYPKQVLEVTQGKLQAPSAPHSVELVTQNWEKNLVVSQWIQESVRKSISLPIEIFSLDHRAYLEHTKGMKSPLFLRSWSADYPDAENFLSVFRSNSGNNRTGWKNAHYDQLVENRQYAAAERLLLDEAIIVPLYFEPNLLLIDPRVENFQLTPLNVTFLRKVHLK